VTEPARLSRIDGARARRGGDYRSWARSLAANFPGLTERDLHLAVHLQLYVDADGSCYPSHDRLAEETRIPLRTVTLLVRRLKDAGAITRKEGTGTGRTAAVYQLVAVPLNDPQLPPRVAAETPAAATQGGSPRVRVEGSSSEVPRSAPKPPKGARDRDLDRWKAALRDWCVSAGLTHAFSEVCIAVRHRGAESYESVVASLPPHLRPRPATTAPGPADQLTLGEEL
jgi:hypothetical protein